MVISFFVRNLILVISSAAVYAASFFYPELFWWGSLVFLAPLFFVHFLPQKEVLLYALLWTFIAYTPHFWCVLLIVFQKALCKAAYGVIPTFFLCFYIPTAVWFCLLMYAQKRDYWYFYSFVTISFFYFWYLYYGFFFMMGLAYGYPLVFPLLPFFIVWPACGSLLWAGGKWALLVTTFFLQALVAARMRFFFILLAMVVGWYGFIFMITQEKKPIHDLAISVYPRFAKKGHEQLAHVQYALRTCEHNAQRMAVLPESAIPFEYRKIPYLGTLLTDDVGLWNTYVFFGTQTEEKGKLYNILAYAYGGRITVAYVKQNLMPFFEKKHWIEDFLEKELFLPIKEQMASGGSSLWIEVAGVGYVRPLICSEALWHFPWGQPFPVLIIVNDAHLESLYAKKLLRATVTLQAQTNKNNLIYSAYS